MTDKSKKPSIDESFQPVMPIPRKRDTPIIEHAAVDSIITQNKEDI